MAQRVVRNVEEDYLMCSICLGRYTEPKLLPCGHTFCKQCLSDHITQTVSNSDSLTFNCPNDRTEVTRPADVHPRDWADKFPTDSFLNNLLLAVRVHEGTAPREALNQQMAPNTSRQTTQRPPQHHDQVVVPTHRRRQPATNPRGASGSQPRGPTCAEHPDREQGFYCLGCNILVCPSCAVRNHRKRTCECLEIENAVDRMQPRIQALRTKFESQINRIYQISENAIPDGGSLQNSKARAHHQLDDLESKAGRFYALVLQHIEDMRQQVNQVTDRAASTFSCPNDRTQVNRPSPGLHPRQWAEKLPTDTFLKSLLQAVQVYEGSSTLDNRTNGDVGYHHNTDGFHQRQNGPVCAEHPDRAVEFFCLGCNRLVCANCAVRSHRSGSCECITIEEAVERMRPRIQALRRRFESQIHKINQINAGEVTTDGSLESSKARAQYALDELESRAGLFYQIVLQYIEDLRQQIREAGRGFMSENQQLNIVLNSIESTRHVFESLCNNNAGVEILNDLPKMEAQADEV
ncbi:hypothetical protein FSP39_001132 [Pinctada imbricata]|uniref:Uncharacterized protein n=1 Tax=Pinctada imbricata TaxID=66713 RepID=A0AA89BJZ8_PINIB|nr:hypothetical protein FSP39_001132 [Pinctada imbricata]